MPPLALSLGWGSILEEQPGWLGCDWDVATVNKVWAKGPAIRAGARAQGSLALAETEVTASSAWEINRAQ